MYATAYFVCVTFGPYRSQKPYAIHYIVEVFVKNKLQRVSNVIFVVIDICSCNIRWWHIQWYAFRSCEQAVWSIYQFKPL